jgi:crotonobetaine/carnitine-CoA ligase
MEAEIGEMDIKLFVQPGAGKTIDPASLAEWARPRLSRYQLPRYFAVVPEFPRTPSQRIRKHELARTLDDSWDRLAQGR